MTINNNITTLLVGAALLASCSEDLTAPAYTVGAADNAITLRAGIGEGGAGVQTRAVADPDANHAQHVSLKENTVMRLRVDGDWWKQGATSAMEIKKITDAKVGNIVANTDDKHRYLTDYTPQLYWDDYGTADPNNTSTPSPGRGREKGLTIYGVAVDGLSTLPDALKNNLDNTANKWQSLSWTLDADQSTNDWKNMDLLISNNVVYNAIDANDNAYKFNDRTSGKLLVFNHAMSKITVRLIASDGFPTSGTNLVGNTTNKFEKAPEVTLTSNEGTATTNTEWPLTSGNVNIETGAISNLTSNAKVNMHTQATPTDKYTAILDALVMPGSCFGAADNAIIARINADGNIYYVTAKEIRTKMHSLNNSTDYKTESGKNYIITVTVKKTKIEVTATVTDWIDVEAATVEPVINVNASVGGKGYGTGSFNSFDFYLSENAASGYVKKGTASAPLGSETKWTFKDESSNDINLYWPTHNTHYHMRGVYPISTTINDSKQIIVGNGAYNSTTSPSNLLIGAPEITAGTQCGNTDHTQVDMSTHGICARNNTINLNFRYVMSQVEVLLKSTGTDELHNKVTIDNNTTVEIIGGYKQARIQLDTRVHDDYTDADKVTDGKYSMTAVATPPEGYTRAMHDIIVPQNLSNEMKFRITVKNSDNTYDVYETQLNKIKGKVKDSSGDPAEITEWKPGEHYIYTLDIKKTEINVTATLTDWVKVEADQPIWF